MTRSFAHRQLAIVAAWFVVAMATAEDSDSISDPTPHPVARYSAIWESGWFNAANPADLSESIAILEEEPFPYKAVGLADWNGNQWVYLLHEAGHVVELTSGLPSHGLSLIRIEADPSGSGDALIHLRQGSRAIPLRLAHGAKLALSPIRPASPKGTPERPYAGWQKNPVRDYRAMGNSGHRVPGTVPNPAAQAALR